jgi:hypothetical protein
MIAQAFANAAAITSSIHRWDGDLEFLFEHDPFRKDRFRPRIKSGAGLRDHALTATRFAIAKAEPI